MTVLAVQQLAPAASALLERLWSEARADVQRAYAERAHATILR
jgi:hypothetical protein